MSTEPDFQGVHYADLSTVASNLSHVPADHLKLILSKPPGTDRQADSAWRRLCSAYNVSTAPAGVAKDKRAYFQLRQCQAEVTTCRGEIARLRGMIEVLGQQLEVCRMELARSRLELERHSRDSNLAHGSITRNCEEHRAGMMKRKKKGLE